MKRNGRSRRSGAAAPPRASFSRRIAAALIALAAPASAAAQSAGALGDWGGARSALARQGLRLELVYTGEAVRNFSGGLRQGSAQLGELDLKATLDGERALGVPGLTAFVHGLRTHGDDPGELVGDAQGVSNIAAPARWRLFEAWVQQNFPERNASLLAGRFDLNAEFYHLDTADLFLNSSYGIGPEFSQSGRGGPSIFPESSLGARGELRVAPFVLRAAVLNGVPVNVPRADGSTGLHRGGDGSLLVAEAGLVAPFAVPQPQDRTRPRRLRMGRAALAVERDTKAALGWWQYGGGSSGGYFVGEQVVYRDARSPSRRLRVFVQLGAGDERADRFGKYAGAGATLTSPLPGRSDDELGIAFAAARSGAGFREQARLAGEPEPGTETAIELTYLIVVRSWLSVQPSLQRILHPGGAPGLRDSSVGLVRVEIAF